MRRFLGAAPPRQNRDEVLVSAGDEVGGTDDHDEANEGGAGGESRAPLAPAAVGPGDDPRNTDQHRNGTVRPENVDRMERRDDAHGKHNGVDDQAMATQ